MGLYNNYYFFCKSIPLSGIFIHLNLYNIMKRTIKTIFLALCYSAVTNGQTSTPIHLPAIFSDHMVLQQKSTVSIWGWGEASTTVKLVGSWMPNDTISTSVDDCGRWRTKIPTCGHGGPYTLQISTDNRKENKIILKDILLGEVWLCSGQSNMEWSPNNGIHNRQEEIDNANHSHIRFFSLSKQGSKSPQEDCYAQWEQCTPEIMQKRSAIAYFFGKRLQQKLNVPIGLIVSAWGGTPAEVWTPKDTVINNKVIAEAVINKPYPWWPVTPGVLYNSMIHPLMPYDIAGAIWYQGESNRDNPSSYNLLMEKMIASWRKGFGKNFPFYMVQIAPYNYHSTNNGPALIREAQEQVAHRVDNVGLITTTDIGDPDNIHPAQKAEAGFRLANLVLGRTYKALKKGYETPFFTQMTIEKGKAILSFSHTEKKLVCPDKKIRGVTIAGNDGNFVPANARIKENRLIVSSPKIKQPIAVRYCFDDATVGNLFNAEGLPVAPFRTDR